MKGKILGLLAVGLMAGPMNAQSATLQVSGGILTGALGVNVNGTLYDVSFQEGTCVALFSGCDEASDFSTIPSGAASALINQVVINGPDGNFDSQPELTFGCTSTALCYIYLPWEILAGAPNQMLVSAFENDASPNSIVSDWYQVLGNISTLSDSGLNATAVWAVFRLATTTPVPEPGTLALLSLGLAGLGLSRRRKAN